MITSIEGDCPCGSSRRYRDCCRPLHQLDVAADAPEQLMRSRYSAFALGLTDYLRYTWHPSTCPQPLVLTDQPQWVKLTIISASHSTREGNVHFRAYFNDAGEIGCMEEKSDFILEKGRWFYLCGDVS